MLLPAAKRLCMYTRGKEKQRRVALLRRVTNTLLEVQVKRMYIILDTPQDAFFVFYSMPKNQNFF